MADASILYENFSTKTVERHRIFAHLGMSTSGKFVTCRVADLRLHPSYVRNGLTVSASQLSTLVELGELPFLDSIVITRERFVIDGYALLELARQQGLPTLLCIELDLNEAEGLKWLLWKSRQSHALNAFCRILLALDLQPSLREKARSNQRAGGQKKGSSKLTNGETVDVRSDVARAAGVCTGNVTKVTQILKTANLKLRGIATNYFSDEPGSLLDYFWLSSGSGEHAFGCGGWGCTGIVTDDNIFRELDKYGLSWKVYADSLCGLHGHAIG